MRWICAILLLFEFSTALSQESDSTTTLSEVVVSANRWEQDNGEISARIVKALPALVWYSNPQTGADFLNATGQVYIQKSQLGGGSPMIRGFATNRIMLVVDGVRMNNAIFRGGNLQNVISIDPNMLAESEIVFGPGAVMYGSDAIGGVLDFHTSNPKSTDSVKLIPRVMTRYSSANNEKTIHVNLDYTINKLSFYTGYTKSEYGDLKMGSHGPDEYLRPDYQITEDLVNKTVTNPDPQVQVQSGFSQQNFLQNVNFTPSAELKLTYTFYYSATSNVPRYDRLLLKNGVSVFSNAEWYYGPQKWQMHTLQARSVHKTAITDEIKFIVAWQDYQESRHSRNYGGGNRLRRTNRYERVKILSANLDLNKIIRPNTSIYYGSEFVTNLVGSTANRIDLTTNQVSGTSTRYPDGSRWTSAAVYASSRTYLNHNLVFNTGLRLTSIQSRSTFDTTYFKFPFTKTNVVNTSLNGSLGLVKNIDESKLYLNLSSGFRAPNIDDLGKVFDSQAGAVVVPNNTIRPEKAWQAEIGIQSNPQQKIGFDAALYTTYLTDAIARGAYTFNGSDSILYDGTLSKVYAQQNIGLVKIYGIQTSFHWNLTKSIKLSGNLNYQKGTERDPESGKYYSPTHVAPFFGRLSASYIRNSFGVTLFTNFNGEINYTNLALTERADKHLYAKDGNGNPYAPGWAVYSIRGWLKVGKVLVTSEVENLTDLRYRPYSSGITAPGRNFIVSVRYGF